jgi:DnaJ family protein A protein 2
LFLRYGEEGLKEGGADHFTNASSLFEQLFGGLGFGFGGGGRSANRKGEDVVHHLRLNLEDLYTGITKKLAVTRQIVCPECDVYFIDIVYNY